MKQFITKQIGVVENKDGDVIVKVDKAYRPALQALDGFSHLQVFWWFDGCDDEASRSALEFPSPYKHSPKIMGIFATRSPMRPNPIALSTAEIISIDYENGMIRLAYIDANDGTPVVDLKPYTPSMDRIENPGVPEWCAHWPKSYETSGEFDWEGEFNF